MPLFGKKKKSAGILKTYEKALNDAFEAMKAGEDDKAQLLFRRVLRWVTEDFDKIVSLDDEEKKKLSNLLTKAGEAMIRLKDYDYAIKTLEKAKTINPKNYRAFMAIGKDLLQRNTQIPYALVCLREAAKLKPDNIEVHLLLGDAYRVQEQMDKALAAYQKALKIDPNNLDAIEKVLKIQPDNVDLLERYAKALEKKKDKEELLKVYNRLVALTENEEYLEKGLKLDPENKDLLITKARLLINKDNYDEARKIAEKLIEKYPDDPDVQMLYDELGEKDIEEEAAEVGTIEVDELFGDLDIGMEETEESPIEQINVEESTPEPQLAQESAVQQPPTEEKAPEPQPETVPEKPVVQEKAPPSRRPMVVKLPPSKQETEEKTEIPKETETKKPAPSAETVTEVKEPEIEKRAEMEKPPEPEPEIKVEEKAPEPKPVQEKAEQRPPVEEKAPAPQPETAQPPQPEEIAEQKPQPEEEKPAPEEKKDPFEEFMEAYGAGDYARATELLKEMSDEDLSKLLYAGSHVLRFAGEKLAELGRLDMAEKIVNKFVSKEDTKDAYYLRALVLIQQGKYDEAEKDLNEILKRDMKNGKAMFQKARIKAMQGVEMAARNFLMMALKFNPELKEEAKKEPEFQRYKDKDWFKKLVS